MSQQVDYYIDDNETIYASVILAGATASAGTGDNITFSIDDLTELSGQSTVYVNMVKFRFDAYNENRADVSKSIAYCVAGIVPVGTIPDFNNGLAKLEDYQQIKGWPLKGCYGYEGLLPSDPGLVPVSADSGHQAWSVPSPKAHLPP